MAWAGGRHGYGFNGRFAKPARRDFNAHRPLRGDDDLDLTFRRREQRKVSLSVGLPGIATADAIPAPYGDTASCLPFAHRLCAGGPRGDGGRGPCCDVEPGSCRGAVHQPEHRSGCPSDQVSVGDCKWSLKRGDRFVVPSWAAYTAHCNATSPRTLELLRFRDSTTFEGLHVPRSTSIEVE